MEEDKKKGRKSFAYVTGLIIANVTWICMSAVLVAATVKFILWMF